MWAGQINVFPHSSKTTKDTLADGLFVFKRFFNTIWSIHITLLAHRDDVRTAKRRKKMFEEFRKMYFELYGVVLTEEEVVKQVNGLLGFYKAVLL